MSREKFPWIYADLDSRRAGAKPRFDPPIHTCPKCGRRWLCSDRYVQDYCSPQKEFPDWNDITCSMCLAGEVYDDEDRATWWETNAA